MFYVKLRIHILIHKLCKCIKNKKNRFSRNFFRILKFTHKFFLCVFFFFSKKFLRKKFIFLKFSFLYANKSKDHIMMLKFLFSYYFRKNKKFFFEKVKKLA